MFTHKKTTNTPLGTSNNTGLLSRLRSSNRPATASKPVYTTSSRTSKPSIFKKKSTAAGPAPMSHHNKKTVARGPAPVSHHRAKPTLSQKVHGAKTVMSGKMHNNHQEVRAGEREMEGKTTSTGFGSGTRV